MVLSGHWDFFAVFDTKAPTNFQSLCNIVPRGTFEMHFLDSSHIKGDQKRSKATKNNERGNKKNE